MEKIIDRLQFVSQGDTDEVQLYGIKRVLDVGLKWIQLRCKLYAYEEHVALARQVRELCSSYHAKLIINDNVGIAKEVQADGVHLGLDDMAIQKARDILGKDVIIGGTANTIEHVEQRIAEGCDYIGLGPFAFTTTKEKLSPILGIEGYSAILKNRSVASVPIVAIGGIQLRDIDALLKNGLHGVALSGALLHAPTTEIMDACEKMDIKPGRVLC